MDVGGKGGAKKHLDGVVPDARRGKRGAGLKL
jgi:hypothetical protein